MNAGVVGQEGKSHVESHRRFYRGVRNSDRTVMGMDPAKPGECDKTALIVRRTVRTMDEFNAACREAKLLNSTGLKFRAGVLQMSFCEE